MTGRRADGRAGLWGHILVAVSACVLTVSIVGSAVYLSFRAYGQYQYRDRVRAFVSSLQNRTPEELEAVVDELKAKRRLARYVMPQVLRVVTESESERQQVAAVIVSRAFLDKNRIRKALFRLRNDPRESVAGMAVAVLSHAEPAERAAEMLGRCLETPSGTVVDEACAGLLRLGEVGRRVMEQHQSQLSVERRVWLVGFVRECGAADRAAWLEMLKSDEDERVRAAAAEALEGVSATASAGRNVRRKRWPRLADETGGVPDISL